MLHSPNIVTLNFLFFLSTTVHHGRTSFAHILTLDILTFEHRDLGIRVHSLRALTTPDIGYHSVAPAADLIFLLNFGQIGVA